MLAWQLLTSAKYKVSGSAQIVKDYVADDEGVNVTIHITEEDCDNWVSQCYRKFTYMCV